MDLNIDVAAFAIAAIQLDVVCGKIGLGEAMSDRSAYIRAAVQEKLQADGLLPSG